MTILGVVGMKFGRWTAINKEPNKGKYICYRFRCECGTESVLTLSSVKSGNSLSCGCYQKELASLRRTSHGKSATPTYAAWNTMRQRCSNPNNGKFKNYGARGITVCDRWNTFENFLEDMGERPHGLTLDRINNSLGYFKGNCRWASQQDQQNNRRNNKLVEFDGKTMTVAQWERHLGVAKDFLKRRLLEGFSMERAINTPKRILSKKSIELHG
jgi:hypothetical protein